MPTDIPLPAAFDPTSETNKVLAAAKKPLFKKFFWNNSDHLYDAVKLAYLLVVFGRDDEAFEITQALARVPPTTSKDIIAPAQLALALQARILRLRGRLSEAQQCVKRIRETGFSERRLEGVLLNRNDTIPEAIKLGNKKVERSARLTQASELVFISELGGSDTCPVAKMERDYEENLSALKTLVGIGP